MALERAAAVRMPWEQMMEDEDQRVCIESWMRRKGRLGVLDNAAGTPFGHNREPSEISGKNAKNR